MKAFCDGSGSISQSSHVVLAGVAAEEHVWTGFEKGWSDVLKARDPVAPYLHMKEVASGNGAFTVEKGWDDDKRNKLVSDCVMYAQYLDKQLFRTFVCSVEMTPYRLLKEEHPTFPSVATICNKYVPMQIFKWYLEKLSTLGKPELYYFFDQNESYRGPFETVVNKNKRKSRRGLFNHWEMIELVTEVNMRKFLPLQLADMIAWAHHRKLNPHEENARWSSLHVMTDAVFPFVRKDVTATDLKYIALHLPIGTIVKDYFGGLTHPSEE